MRSELFFGIFKLKAFHARIIARLIAAATVFAACSAPDAFAQQPTSAGEAPTPVALLIGNSIYPGAGDPLKHPFKDARKLADELKKRGFEILGIGKEQVGQDLTKEQMRAAIDTFYSRIKPGSAALT